MIDRSIEASLGRHPHIACVGGKVYVCVGYTFTAVVGLTKNGDTAGNLHSGLFRTDSSADAYADCREACGILHAHAAAWNTSAGLWLWSRNHNP